MLANITGVLANVTGVSHACICFFLGAPPNTHVARIPHGLPVLQGCDKIVTRTMQGFRKGINTHRISQPRLGSDTPVTRGSQGCYKSVARVLKGCYKCVTRCHRGVPTLWWVPAPASREACLSYPWSSHPTQASAPKVLQRCYKGVTRVLRGCQKGVTRV
jgi:hypothetical protein